VTKQLKLGSHSFCSVVARYLNYKHSKFNDGAQNSGCGCELTCLLHIHCDIIAEARMILFLVKIAEGRLVLLFFCVKSLTTELEGYPLLNILDKTYVHCISTEN